MTRRKAKYTFWCVEGIAYGRVDEFPTVEAFLARRYNVTWEEDEREAFFEDWKESHPLAQFLMDERTKVQRSWYRYSYMDGGDLCLDYAKPHTRGAFELWEWGS